MTARRAVTVLMAVLCSCGALADEAGTGAAEERPAPRSHPRLVPVRLTVGVGGDHQTIQAAVDAAVPGSDTVIDVEADTYTENVAISGGWTSGSLTIAGGWNSTFTEQSPDPALTVINGGAAGSVVLVNLAGGSFTLESFTITNGQAASGAGIGVGPTGTAVVTIHNNRIVGNTATSGGSAYGGGVFAGLSGSQQLVVSRCTIKLNTAETTALAGFDEGVGGGLVISAGDSSSFLVQDTEVQQNTASGSGATRKDGGGLALFLSGSASGQLLDTDISGNALSGPSIGIRASGALVLAEGDSDMLARRISMAANADPVSGTSFQLLGASRVTARLRATELGIIAGDDGGGQLEGANSGELYLSNLTVADNAGTGLSLLEFDASAVTVYNSILFGNGTDASFAAGVSAAADLIGVDPLFVDAAGWDYHLRIGSPAEDQGDNLAPGDLGPTDFDGGPRVLNGVVDIGVYEGIAEVFSDGFESGDVLMWSGWTP